MSKHNVIIQRQTRKVIVPKAFMIAASQYGTEEFRMYQEIQQRYPGFAIEVAAPVHKNNGSVLGKLDYDSMKQFIIGHEATAEAANAVLEELSTVREFAKGRRGAYLMVKKWFCEKYSAEIERLKQEKEDQARIEREKNFLYHPVNA